MTGPTRSMIFGCTAAIALIAAAQTAGASDQERTKQELMQIEKNMCKAVVNGDVEAHSAFLADDLTDVFVDGKLVNKEENEAHFKTIKVAVCEAEELHVRLYGDAAVVVGLARVEMEGYTGHIRYTDTFIRRNGRWKIVASQSTAVKR